MSQTPAQSTGTARQIALQVMRQRAASPEDFSLASGSAGIALFCSTMRKRCPDLIAPELIDALVDAVQHQVAAADDFLPGLWAGLAGTAFAMERIAIDLGTAAAALSRLNEDIDQWVLDGMRDGSAPGHHDLVLGLAGLGMYALSRSDQQVRARLFSQIFLQLLERAETMPQRHCWISRRPYLTAPQQRSADACLDLGVAHGNAGVLAMLSLAVHSGMDAPGLAETTRGLAHWVLDQERAGDAGAFGFVAGDQERSRDAWCYGDPAMALALMRCGNSLNDRQIFARGAAIGLRAAQRSVGAADHDDAGICHGYAGLSIMNRHMYGLCSHPAFAQAAAKADAGIIRVFHRGGDRGQRPDPGLWNGMSGMGLALIAADTAWLPFLAL